MYYIHLHYITYYIHPHYIPLLTQSEARGGAYEGLGPPVAGDHEGLGEPQHPDAAHEALGEGVLPQLPHQRVHQQRQEEERRADQQTHGVHLLLEMGPVVHGSALWVTGNRKSMASVFNTVHFPQKSQTWSNDMDAASQSQSHNTTRESMPSQ